MGKELDKALLFIFMLIGAVVVSMTSNQEVKAHELEVLEMHDVPCTTIVDPERVEWPQVKPRLVVLGLPALSDRALARYMAAAEGMSNG